MNIDDTDNKVQKTAESKSHQIPVRQILYNSTANLGLLPGSDPFPIDVPQPKKSSKNVGNETNKVGSNE